MKALTKVQEHALKGSTKPVVHQAFKVQRKDVGQTRPNYLGHRRIDDYTFRKEDVGRSVVVITTENSNERWAFVPESLIGLFLLNLSVEKMGLA